jgi:prephenate dehydrogenase
MTKYGVIGQGSFGQLLVDLLPADDTNFVVSSRQLTGLPASTQQVSLQEMCQQSDVIFLSIPLSAYEKVCSDLSLHLKPETLVVDIASVKVKPQEILPKLLPTHKDILFTHPLFGPQSVNGKDLSSVKFVVTKVGGPNSESVIKVFSDLGAEIVYMTAEEHDQQMSYTHALTFFISHALAKMDVKDVELSAPSYKKLLALRDLDHSHSEDLLNTIQSGNPYSSEIRKKLIETLVEIDRQADENN